MCLQIIFDFLKFILLFFEKKGNFGSSQTQTQQTKPEWLSVYLIFFKKKFVIKIVF